MAHFLMYLGAIFFAAAACIVGGFLLWNMSLFLYRISEILWKTTFGESWMD